MSSVEVLCATMDQVDCLVKYKEMNIQSDVIFANQADCFKLEIREINNNTVKMITTPYRGVGNNRNMALLFSTAKIVLFADDDLVYSDEYVKYVEKAYKELPDADFIIFNRDNSDGIKRRNTNKIKRVRWWNFLAYGTCRFSARISSLKRANIMFNQLFGGGCPYSCGEDNLFLKDVLAKGLKVYTYPYTLFDIRPSISTWFEGYTSKFFYDHGAWMQATFPYLKYLLIYYYYITFRRRNMGKNLRLFKLMKAGIVGYKKTITYDQWVSKDESLNL